MKYTLTPEILERFNAYEAKDCAWGSLHVVLSDNNIRDIFVQGCIEYAQEKGDLEGEFLAKELLKMSQTQRKKLGRGGYK